MTNCPTCGHTLEDDGDRYYLDFCWWCGWRSDEQRRRDQQNLERLKETAHHPLPSVRDWPVR